MIEPFRSIAIYWNQTLDEHPEVKSVLRYEFMTLDVSSGLTLPKADFSKFVSLGLNVTVDEMLENPVSYFIRAHVALLEQLNDSSYETRDVKCVRLSSEEHIDLAHEKLTELLYPGLYQEWLGK